MTEAILSWSGAIISFIGTGITVFQVIKVRKDKKVVEKYALQVQVNLQMTEISTLIEKGNRAKNVVVKYSSKSKTKIGLNEAKDKGVVQDFFTSVNEKKHLLISSNTESLLIDGRNYLTTNDYDNLLFNISDILSLLGKKKDSIFLYDNNQKQKKERRLWIR